MANIIPTNIQTDYSRAFNNAFTTIWGNTPFSTETENLSYFRAMTCFLGSEEDDIADRRRLVYEYLSNDFSADKASDTIVQLYNILPIEQSITRIMRNLCTLYTAPPVRKFSAGDGVGVYAKYSIDSYLKQAHRYGKYLNSVLVMPVVRDGNIEIDILPPDLFRVNTDPKDYKKITELWIPYSEIDNGGNTVYRFKVWTDRTYEVRDSDNNVVTRTLENGEKVTTEPNKYGRIPAVVLQFENSKTNFYGGGLWELLLATLDDNKLRFLVDNDVVYSAFSVWIATNFGKSNVSIAPNRMIKVDGVTTPDAGMPMPPTLESVSGNGSFLNIEELRDIRFKRALRKEGLPESSIQGNPGMAASGVAMLLDRKELDEKRAEDEVVMKRFERDFYSMLALVGNTDLFLNLPAAEITINYADGITYSDPAIEVEAKKLQFEAGYIGAKMYLSTIIDDDEIADDRAAIEYIKKNKELLKELNGTDTTTNGQDNQIQEQGTSGVVPTESRFGTV